MHAACRDTPVPGDTFTCKEQAAFGKCGASWMKGYCDVSCRRCGAGTPAGPPAAPRPSAPVASIPNDRGVHRCRPLSPHPSRASIVLLCSILFIGVYHSDWAQLKPPPSPTNTHRDLPTLLRGFMLKPNQTLVLFFRQQSWCVGHQSDLPLWK